MAVTVNIDSQIVVKTAAQWAADSTVYSSQRILVTSDVTYTNSDQRKFKIADGVQTWSNLDYMPIAQTLAEVLANDNDTNNLDIVSPNGKSIATIQNSFIRLLHDDGNDSELYLHAADATLKTATGGFYVNETALTDTKFIQIKSASTTIQHDTTVSVNTPNVNLPQETASRIAIFDASKNVKAANTTTYPDLTELSYVKGVTSAIQTQLNGKQATLTNPVTGTGTNNEIAAFNSTGSTITSLTTATYPSLTELSYVKGVTSAIQTQLNGKQDVNGGVTVIYRDFATSAALTGTTAITLINSALIPANTVAVNDEVEIKARAQRNTTTGTATHYLYYNTSASLSGATLIGSVAAAGGYFATVRGFFVKSSTDSETSNSALGIASSDAATGGAATTVSNFNIDWTSNVYIIQAFANAAVGNSTTSNGIIIKRSRL
jgi:hypothetical protein